MARPLRIEFPGALYHLMSRGNERRRIVRDDADRAKRIDWLRRTVDRYGWRLHAFTLMDNHDHLFVETPEANLAAGMQFLNGSYTNYYNRRHRRSGHLFQGRYKGHLIDDDGYFLEVSRYIHLNPVRAKMVDRPEEYRFSSCPGYLRQSRALKWITYDRVLGEMAGRPNVARRAYGRFVRAGIEQRPRSPFAQAAGGLLLGSEAFLGRIGKLLQERETDVSLPQLEPLRRRPSLDQIAETVAQHFGDDRNTWQPGRRSDDAGRAVAAYLARRRFGYPAREVAAGLGYRGHSGVHNAVRRVESSAATLKTAVEKLARKLR